MGAKLDTLADAIDMATKFDEDFARSQEVHKKKGLLSPLMKFKKVLSIFKGL